MDSMSKQGKHLRHGGGDFWRQNEFSPREVAYFESLSDGSWLDYFSQGLRQRHDAIMCYLGRSADHCILYSLRAFSLWASNHSDEGF